MMETEEYPNPEHIGVSDVPHWILEYIDVIREVTS